MDKYLIEIADRYKEKREEKEVAKFQLSEINAELEEIERNLLEAMLNNEMESFKHNGTNFVMVTKEYPAAVPERKLELYSKMKEQGYEHLFTINTNTLASTLKEMKANNEGEFPSWLGDMVKMAEKQSIQMRKSK